MANGAPAFEQYLLVKSDAGLRIMRGQANRHHLSHVVRFHLPQRVGDEGMPITHADIGRDAQLAGDTVGLRLGNPGQRRAADQ